MTSTDWLAGVVQADREYMLSSWRQLAGQVEARLREVGLREGDLLIAAVRTLLERWLDGTASVSEATQLALAGRLAAAQYALREDGRELMRTAYHEAGHAVVAWSLGVGLKLVTVRPEVGYDNAGHCALADFPEGTPAELAEWTVLIFLAGRTACEVARDAAPGRGGERDEDEVQRLIYLCRPGMGHMEAAALLYYCRLRTGELVRRLWPAVEALADQLYQRLEIPGGEAEAILAGAVPGIRPSIQEAIAA